mgnify:CR=1 FL=1
MGAATLGTLLGGVGLFLLGMSLMTDSLTALGGRTLRSIMRRLIHRRSAALATGTVATALLQSSSATTLITVGFVSAGLVTFSESLGLILGANIGTTSTGWIVSMVGLKFKVSALALPLVGVGALVRLFTRGRWARLGLALSGFGLVFVGIDVMQQAMSDSSVDIAWGESLPAPLRIAVLVGVGALMTVVMQSSSAAVAATLVALHAGSLDLEQAAAMVVGQNVGTTVTAILGALGGSLSARRTAVAHTLFNLFTAAIALAMLRPFLSAVTGMGRLWFDDTPETAVSLFHTAFNLLGVAVVYPWLGRFAKVVERIVPQPADALVVDLPRSALGVPAVALQAAHNATVQAARECLHIALLALRGPSRDAGRRLHAAERSLRKIEQYLAEVQTARNRGELQGDHIELLRAVDHTHRLLAVAHSATRRETAQREHELRTIADPILETCAPLVDAPLDAQWLSVANDTITACAAADRKRRRRHRDEVMRRIATGELEADEGARLLASSRWIGKTPKQAAAAFRHLSRIGNTDAA